jgi:hypothetical protein
MNTHRCCKIAANDSLTDPLAGQAMGRRSHPQAFVRRCFDIAGWIVPGAILALLPKCPACLAAYVAVGTGLGFSVTAATHLRASLLILCVATLLCLVVKRLCRFTVQTKENIL